MKLNKLFTSVIMGDIFAIIAGALLTLAFAPFAIFPLAVIAPAFLLSLWLTVSPKRAFWRGWLFGLGFFSTGIYWVFISIHTYGNTSIFLACFITCIFVALLAVFPGLTGYLLSRYFPFNDNTKLVAAFPTLWVLLEWIRSWIFTGFPWLLLGTSQVSSPLKGYAPLLGVYGVSLIVLISSGLLVNSLMAYRQKAYKNSSLSLCLGLLIWIGGAILSGISWTETKNNPIKVSLIQGNIEQQIMWSYDQVMPTLDRYQQLTEKHWDSKIIIWPENAIPIPLQNAKDFVDLMSEKAKKHNATIIAGIPAKHGSKDAYYNAVIAFGHDDDYYLKRRLVPFGEYTPFPGLLSRLLDSFNIPMSNMTVGETVALPLKVQGLKIATFICYEIAFPEQVLQGDKDIDLLLTVSNDGWFGHSIAQAQHLEMAQMRALEMGRPVLFVSNTGITAIVKSNGQIQSAAPPYEKYVLTDTIRTVSGQTPWQKRGMDPIFIIMITLLFHSIRSMKKIRKRAS